MNCEEQMKCYAFSSGGFQDWHTLPEIPNVTQTSPFTSKFWILKSLLFLGGHCRDSFKHTKYKKYAWNMPVY